MSFCKFLGVLLEKKTKTNVSGMEKSSEQANGCNKPLGLEVPAQSRIMKKAAL